MGVTEYCASSVGGMVSSARDLDVTSVFMAGAPKRLSFIPQLFVLSESRLARILLRSSLSYALRDGRVGVLRNRPSPWLSDDVRITSFCRVAYVAMGYVSEGARLCIQALATG